ncbi:phosphatidylglycerophosphatase A family protein [Pedosphaera parvula]|uniref:Phosphatidylglycerophosphatase A n=1 Tax=Pedosphaera parvula (strain Ellin514) TaxID=320771 RepID=B9XHC3_PEDPL|nr:phosphatidylglycerophosphatase A [Pedosphaera parvula]EEF60758.1 phosphatidylglycerophosphatase A [Pedosphaera parvula Ellin514]
MGAYEIILILALLLILFGVSRWSRFGKGFKRGMEEFINATGEVTKEMQDAMGSEDPSKKDRRDGPSNGAVANFVLWVAQGFGSGRIPWAPGTFGSLVGLVWFAALLAGGSYWLYLIGCAVGIVASVQLCGAAEKILDETDPPSVVLDEIIAIPICFLGWVSFIYFKTGFLPEPQYFFSRQTWLITVAVYVLFRLFDIAKPWPVKQSQSLPGGWGVTIDDVLAAVYVNLVVLAAHALYIAQHHRG